MWKMVEPLNRAFTWPETVIFLSAVNIKDPERCKPFKLQDGEVWNSFIYEKLVPPPRLLRRFLKKQVSVSLAFVCRSNFRLAASRSTRLSVALSRTLVSDAQSCSDQRAVKSRGKHWREDLRSVCHVSRNSQSEKPLLSEVLLFGVFRLSSSRVVVFI